MIISKTTINDYLHKHLLPPGKTLRPGEALFSNGAIDSLGVLQLIAWLEKEFRITIDTQQHELTDFDTVDRIVQVVERLCANVSRH